MRGDLVEKIAAYMKVGDTIKITTLMRRFRVSRDDVETAVEDLNQTRGGFDLIVGGQIPGAGYWCAIREPIMKWRDINEDVPSQDRLHRHPRHYH